MRCSLYMTAPVLALVAASGLAQQAISGDEPVSRAVATEASEPASRWAFDFADALRTGGEPLTADQAAKLAVASAPSVARAREVNTKARAAASEALVALYPRLDLEARYTRLSDESSGISFGGVSEFDFSGLADTDLAALGVQQVPFRTRADSDPPLLDQFMLQARLSYPVSDLFFTILPRYEASRDAARSEELNVRARELSVALEAREAYYNYARVRAAQLVSESAVAQSLAQRSDVEAKVRAGALAQVELMRIDAVVASARVAEARARGSVDIARTALQTLLHLDGRELAIAEDLTRPLPLLTEDTSKLMAMARQNRSELLALRAMAGVQGQLADASRADGYPKVGVGASVELGNPNPRASAFESEWTTSWAALATLTWSPNGYRVYGARADQARADEMATQHDLNALEDRLRLEVTSAHADYRAASAAMDAAEAAIRAAEQSYLSRRDMFRAGAAVATDVIDAEEELRRARLDLINAAIDTRIARARLDRAIERPSR